MTPESGKNIKKIRSFDGGMLQIECHDSITSTSSVAKKYANAGFPDRYMVFSPIQTESDVFGERISDGQVAHGMFLSCILRPSMFPSQAGLLRALSSVAMITALEAHTSKPLGIGWVSDIFCEKRRIGAVTLEGKLDSFTTYEYIIITFRMKISEENFPPRLVDMVKSVFESGSNSTELIIAQNILAKFFPLYFNMKNQSKFMDIYKSKFAMRDLSAKYFDNGKKKRCKVVNVDTQSGALLIRQRNGEIASVSSPTNVILPKRVKLLK